VQVHKVLVATHAETIEAMTSKWLHTKNPPHPPSPILQATPPPSQLNQSIYPRVRFWTKQDWKDYENNCKDSSDLVAPSSSGARGGTRAALGENIRVRYVKHVSDASHGSVEYR